jgi:hypothetical protein
MLTAGQRYAVRMEYFENGGGAKVSLLWSSWCQGKVPVPATQLYPTSAAPDGGAPADAGLDATSAGSDGGPPGPDAGPGPGAGSADAGSGP